MLNKNFLLKKKDFFIDIKRFDIIIIMNEIFDYFKKIFNKAGYRLYMIGSSSRDYLLNREINDYDFVTDALPNEVATFLNVSKTFSKYGVSQTKYKDKHIDIVTLRKEYDYNDFRHPSRIEFIKDINEDYLRRDFTINAIYIDENYNIIDPSNGVNDLKNKNIRFIKDPLTSIKEDPLRILRCYRFIKEYDLNIDDNTLKILKENEYLLNNLNKDKIKEEERKMKKYE